jgi:hypothetical protein
MLWRAEGAYEGGSVESFEASMEKMLEREREERGKERYSWTPKVCAHNAMLKMPLYGH